MFWHSRRENGCGPKGTGEDADQVDVELDGGDSCSENGLAASGDGNEMGSSKG